MNGYSRQQNSTARSRTLLGEYRILTTLSQPHRIKPPQLPAYLISHILDTSGPLHHRLSRRPEAYG